MPLFEYSCRGCGRRFEAFVTRDRAPACPGCHGIELDKLLSSPGMVSAANGSRAAAAETLPPCGAQGGHCACGHNQN